MREEGSNGDREMAAAVYSGGMEPWDVTMSDLLNGRASLDSFQGKHPNTFCRVLMIYCTTELERVLSWAVCRHKKA